MKKDEKHCHMSIVVSDCRSLVSCLLICILRNIESFHTVVTPVNLDNAHSAFFVLDTSLTGIQNEKG